MDCNFLLHALKRSKISPQKIDINDDSKLLIIFKIPSASQRVDEFSAVSTAILDKAFIIIDDQFLLRDLQVSSLADHRVAERLLIEAFKMFHRCVEIEKKL